MCTNGIDRYKLQVQVCSGAIGVYSEWPAQEGVAAAICVQTQEMGCLLLTSGYEA